MYQRQPEYRALGLNSRGLAWTIAILGVITSPFIIGIALFFWGAIADHMLAKEAKRRRREALHRVHRQGRSASDAADDEFARRLGLLDGPTAAAPSAVAVAAPTYFRIIGIDRATACDVDRWIEAPTAGDARLIAEAQGIIVTRVET